MSTTSIEMNLCLAPSGTEPRVPAAQTLPPWGHMLPGFVANVCPPRIPTDFLLRQGEDPANRLTAWVTWRNETLVRLNESIWPRYAPDEKDWIGKSATRMVELTEKDLDLLATIQADPEGLEFYQQPRSPIGMPNCLVHEGLFRIEDGDDFGHVLASYDRTLSKVVPVESLQELFSQGMLRKVSSVSSQFKFFLQRPRPYQAALLLGRNKYLYSSADSANTPSMCSGHALQSLLAIGGMFEAWLKNGTMDRLELRDKSQLALQQWAVDRGDRRVLAGVHYPSDNLASWFIFLRLADRVYTRPEVKQSFWYAIRNQSYVFRKIREAAGNDSGHVYSGALTALYEAAAS